jgi:UDP-N-acetylmuramoylalanine--D-glutamate ligase
MTENKNFFKDKKITVMGLGLLGRGLGVIKFLADQRALLTVTDLKTEAELKPSLVKLARYKNIQYVLGRHRLGDFKKADLIIRAPNAPLNSPYLQAAQKAKVPIEMDASLFAKLAPAGVKLIGITGSRGKSTVTHLLFDILKQAKKRVHLGGNVRGLATLPLLNKVKSGDLVVLELDSWQLQGFGQNKISPQMAIFTSFMVDHLNYYQGNLRRYFKDKSQIYRFQKPEDVLITGGTAKEAILKYGPQPKSKILKPQLQLTKNWPLTVLGKHTRYNMTLATTAAMELGVPKTVIRRVVKNWTGLPGRLEPVETIKGVKYINDTTATTPQALTAAIKAWSVDRNKIILIAGGQDARLDWSEIDKALKKIKAIVLFPGTATDILIKKLPKHLQDQAQVVDNMKEAVNKAKDKAGIGDVVLLSPGAKSFGLFKNEFDRGDQFKYYVRKLK